MEVPPKNFFYAKFLVLFSKRTEKTFHNFCAQHNAKECGKRSCNGKESNMSGHSKWKNIMHKKEKTDAQRAKIFTKIGKEMAIAIREGGADPASNSKLRDLISKAKANNVPNENIERVIKKAQGADSVVYEEITYEGYGPCGVAVIVKTATDNRNRTASEVRHYFDKFGGNLGQTGCVGFLFTDKGVILISDENVSDPDALMEVALEVAVKMEG